jgi:hypothetical protein
MFKRTAQISFDGVNIKPITDLRIIFEIDKDDGSQLNHGTIKIYNLSPKNRAQIAKTHPIGYPLFEPIVKVFLNVGYSNDNVRIIGGELLSAINTKDGKDWITTIEVYSGIKTVTKSIANFSFAKPTKITTIIDKLLKAMQIDFSYTEDAKDLLSNLKTEDYTASGLTFKEVYTVLNRYGASFTIEEDGKGLIYIDDRPRNPTQGQNSQNTFSPNNGLIGSPEITRTGISIRSLLRPRTRIMERIFVKSRTLSNTLRFGTFADYHIKSIKHKGDTRGEDWFTEIEGSYSNLLLDGYLEQ